MLLLCFETGQENGLNHNLNLKRTSPRLFLNNRFMTMRCNIRKKKVKKNFLTTMRRGTKTHVVGIIPDLLGHSQCRLYHSFYSYLLSLYLLTFADVTLYLLNKERRNTRNRVSWCPRVARVAAGHV